MTGRTDFVSLIPQIALIAVMTFGFWIMLSGPLRGHRRRLNFQMHSVGGGNLAMVFATVTVARLLFDATMRSPTSDPTWAVLGAFALVGGVAVLPSVFGRLVPLVALISLMADVFRNDPSVALWLVVVIIALLILLATLRVLRPVG